MSLNLGWEEIKCMRLTVSQDTYIFPLRDTTFEGAPVKIPYQYRVLLESEYGESSLTNTDYEG